MSCTTKFNSKAIFSLLLSTLFSLIIFTECKAITIPGFPNPEADSYTISLNGSILNDVSGLVIKVKLNGNKADIKPSVSFSSMGATTILSNVTGPEGDIFTITLALNGMITDGQASITGKFIESSFSPGAEINLVEVKRDGGDDITNQLTTNITFTVPQVQTTSSSSGSIDTSSSDDNGTTPEPTNTSDNPPPVDILVDYLIGSEGETALNLLNSETADEDFLNKNQDSLNIKGSDSFQLKSKGGNTYYATLKGVLNSKGTEFDSLTCWVASKIKNLSNPEISYGIGALLSTSFFTPTKHSFTVKFPISRFKLRFKKVIKIPFTSTDEGADLLNNTATGESYRGSVDTACVAYDSNNQALIDYLSQNKSNQSELDIFAILRTLASSDYVLLGATKFFNLIPPKVADVGE